MFRSSPQQPSPTPARRRGRAAGTALIGATAALLVGSTSAHAACAATATTKAFSKFGDTADYTAAPGGTFEMGQKAWSLRGASLVTGNEPFFINSTRDVRSLTVTPTGTAVSPTFCVGVEHPTFRMIARRTTGSWGTLLVKLRWTEKTGQVNETTLASLDGSAHAKWAATPPLKLATVLPLWKADQSVTAQLVLDPENYGGAWQVDDVFIDPYRRS